MLVVLCAVLGMAGIAEAGRKRVVVLELEGPKADKFHADLVKLLKKSHTVISADKWNGTAEELGATGLSEKSLKKVAKRLKIDAIIEGRIEKRREAYIIHLKLHAGKTGQLVAGSIDTKAEGPRIDGKAKRDLKDELLEALDGLEANRDWEVASDDGEDRPSRRGAKKIEDEDADKPAKKTKDEDDEDERPARKGFGKLKDDERGGSKDDDEEDGERQPRGKKVAAADDESSAEVEAEPGPALDAALALSPAERALDAVAGVSLTMRRMGFSTRSGFTAKPAGYRGTPVGGGMLDATLYPLAIGHSRRGVLKNIGLTVMYDRVIGINTKAPDGTKLDTRESRYAIGAVFRHALGRSADAMVVGGSLAYGRQFFSISGQTDTTINSTSFVPGVSYTMIEPGGFLRYPLGAKLAVGLDAKLMLFTGAGQIQRPEHFGTTTLFGFEGALNVDYLIKRNIFARAAVRAETIGMSFKGNGTRANSRDGDMTTADVTGARDSYFGGYVTAGYLY